VRDAADAVRGRRMASKGGCMYAESAEEHGERMKGKQEDQECVQAPETCIKPADADAVVRVTRRIYSTSCEEFLTCPTHRLNPDRSIVWSITMPEPVSLARRTFSLHMNPYPRHHNMYRSYNLNHMRYPIILLLELQILNALLISVCGCLMRS
jgi:hypothetical protein